MAEVPDVIVLPGGVVVLTGVSVIECRRLVASGIFATERQDGIPRSRRALELLHALEAAAQTVRAQLDQAAADTADMTDVRTGMGRQPSESSFISSKEAAEMLHITDRQTRRLAADLGGQKRGRSWVFDRALVMDYALESGRVIA